MSNMHRIAWLDANIRGERYPDSRKLAEKFEISTRQAQRDIEYLKYTMGAPLEYLPSKKGYFYSNKTFLLPTNMISDFPWLVEAKAKAAAGKNISIKFWQRQYMSKKILGNISYGMTWTSYVAGVYGALTGAGWWKDEVWKLMGMTGIAFHFIMHETCCPSSVTVYDWMAEP